MKIKHLLAWERGATLLHCEYNVCYYNTSFVEDRLSGFRNAEPKLIISGTHGIKTGPKKDVAFIWRLFIYVGILGSGWWSGWLNLWCDLTIRMLSGDRGTEGGLTRSWDPAGLWHLKLSSAIQDRN